MPADQSGVEPVHPNEVESERSRMTQVDPSISIEHGLSRGLRNRASRIEMDDEEDFEDETAPCDNDHEESE